MAFFTQIKLLQFRNYLSASFQFKEKIIAVSGPNGSGKTNLLEAVYYLCVTKNARPRPDALNVKQGENGFRLEADLNVHDAPNKITAIFRENGKKEFSFNQIPYKKISDHVGVIPCVMIAPDDISIIMEGSEERRKMIDAVLCQIDRHYMEQLMRYNKILQQRNALLKNNLEYQNLDISLLDTYDNLLSDLGQYIYILRKKWLEELLPAIEKHYLRIADGNDQINIQYISRLNGNTLLHLLKQNRHKDIASGRTNYGIHKDDISFLMQNENFKNIASQGQRKSLLFALKLAAFDILSAQFKESPILLLDDIFEKLDQERLHNLLTYVCQYKDIQVLVTDTHQERLEQAFSAIGQTVQHIEL